jgi:thiamine kinase-like enzyme
MTSFPKHIYLRCLSRVVHFYRTKSFSSGKLFFPDLRVFIYGFNNKRGDMEVLDRIISIGESGFVYYDITNDKQKRWILNESNLKLALELYQPTALKGILFKILFPYLHNVDFICRILKVKKKKIFIDNNVSQFLNSIFTQPYDVSYFGGTPSVHQKAVLQISQNGIIRGYCKVSSSRNVKILFEKEFENIKYLENKRVLNIPKVLKLDGIGDDLYFLCLSSVRTKQAKNSSKFRSEHLIFLKDLHQKTIQSISFKCTDYYHMLGELKKNLQRLDAEDQKVIRSFINDVENEYGDSDVNFSFYHGDFTPWNMVINYGQLYVFDFEYSKRTYPPHLDIFHFFMQTEIFVNHNSAQIIISHFNALMRHIEKKLGIDAKFCFKLYLLEIINLYLSRSDEEEKNEKKNYELRLKVLKLLVNTNTSPDTHNL